MAAGKLIQRLRLSVLNEEYIIKRVDECSDPIEHSPQNTMCYNTSRSAHTCAINIRYSFSSLEHNPGRTETTIQASETEINRFRPVWLYPAYETSKSLQWATILFAG